MYWFITILWSTVGTALFWRHLSKQWQNRDIFEKMSIRTLSAFHSIPADPDTGYLSLQFSMARHAVTFLISAVILYFTKSLIVIIILFIFNTLYCWSPISRYRYRKQDLIETAARPEGSSTANLLSGFVKDSFCTVIHAVCSTLLLYMLLIIKP